jgi:group I intron endonuclease
MKVSGVYQIQSKIKPIKIYIGSAIDINERWRKHIDRLTKNKHHSPKLQNHFNKYGESDLQFSILLGCDKDDLIKVEQYFIDTYKPFFNCSPTAGSCLGVKRSDEHKEKLRKIHTGLKASDETKLKQSIKRKGVKKSDETKRLMKLNHVGMLGKTAWNKGLTKETDSRVKKYVDKKEGRFKGENATFYNRKHSEDTIIKMQTSARNRKALKELNLLTNN